MQTIRLNNGVAMPMVGFGVFQMAPEVCERAVAEALEVGYRLIDTASSYKNERAVGAAIRRSGLPREALFVTSKAFVNEMGREATREACLRSLDNLGLDRLDLYLIHMPYGDVVGAWRAMEALLHEGRVRAIGVSNFQGDRLLDLCQCAEIAPAVDQLELHPYYQRAGELALLAELGVRPQAWAPFAEGLGGLFDDPTLTEVAALEVPAPRRSRCAGTSSAASPSSRNPPIAPAWRRTSRSGTSPSTKGRWRASPRSTKAARASSTRAPPPRSAASTATSTIPSSPPCAERQRPPAPRPRPGRRPPSAPSGGAARGRNWA